MSGPSAARGEVARLRGLYAIVGDDAPVERALAAIAGGAAVIQVRMKRAPAGAILAAARRIVEGARHRALVIVNDRVDLALLAGADGVHLGDEDLPVAEARRLAAAWNAPLLVGRTCRTLDDARAAVAQGADHVGFGPIFGTRSKQLPVPPRGVGALREVTAAIGVPVVAIGGIGEANIADVARAGAAAAAVIEDLFGHGDPRERAQLLSAGFAAGEKERGS